MEQVVLLLIQIFVRDLVDKGFEYLIENDDDGGTVITWGNDGDGDGEWDSPFEFVLPSSEPETVVEKSIIIMAQDGTMTVYDENGNITAEDCDTAYSLWVSENGIMNKPIANYTVTEGILLIGFIVGGFAFLRKIFRRKKVV